MFWTAFVGEVLNQSSHHTQGVFPVFRCSSGFFGATVATVEPCTKGWWPSQHLCDAGPFLRRIARPVVIGGAMPWHAAI